MEKRREKRAEKKKKVVPPKKNCKKNVLKSAKPIQVKLSAKPRIYGHTVQLQLQDHVNVNYYMVGEVRFLLNYTPHKMLFYYVPYKT